MFHPGRTQLLARQEVRHAARPQLYHHVRSRASKDVCRFLDHCTHSSFLVDAILQVTYDFLIKWTFRLTLPQRPISSPLGRRFFIVRSDRDSIVTLEDSVQQTISEAPTIAHNRCPFWDHIDLVRLLRPEKAAKGSTIDVAGR